MCKLILFLFLGLSCTSFAQKGCRRNSTSVPFPSTVSVVLELTNYLPGLRYDYQVNNNFGLYALGLYGKYYTEEGYSYTRKHIKSSAGAVVFLPNYTHTPSDIFFGAGINYHYYENVGERTSDLSRLSADINAGIRFRRFVVTILYDVVKIERGASFGIRF